MPKEGAAILSQIEGLMEQFLALDYETPVKQQISSMLEQVRSGMNELRQGADAGGPMMGESPAEEATDTGPETPMEDKGEKPNFQNAREAALPALRRMQKSQEEPSKADQGTDEEKKKKKGKGTKASTY